MASPNLLPGRSRASGQSPWPQTNYTLVRIVTSSGEPHPVYWPLFIKHMSDYYNDGVGTRKLRAKVRDFPGLLHVPRVVLFVWLMGLPHFSPDRKASQRGIFKSFAFAFFRQGQHTDMRSKLLIE